MEKTLTTKQLRELRVKVTGAALLARRVTPRLVRHLFESLELGERLRRRRMSSHERRLRQSLRFGAFVGVAAVGAVAARRVTHHGPPGNDGPELDRF